MKHKHEDISNLHNLHMVPKDPINWNKASKVLHATKLEIKQLNMSFNVT